MTKPMGSKTDKIISTTEIAFFGTIFAIGQHVEMSDQNRYVELPIWIRK